MRPALFAAIAILAPIVAVAEDETAYSALRIVGKKDQDILNRVVEVRGRNGTPQPDVWKIVVDDPRSRGGVREFEVQRGRIISERTPTSRTSTARMNFNQLNLDSDGVFTIVNQESQQAGVPFDKLDYLLKAGATGAPVWEVQVFEGKEFVGRMAIASDTGTVLDRQLQWTKRKDRDRDEQDDRRADNDRRQPDGGWSQSGEPFRGVDDFFHRLGKRFEKRGKQFKKFFDGESR